jgi:hypothetical protein
MRAPALPGLLLLAFVGAVVASVACSNQGEGEVCDTANGNNDCQDGLFCDMSPPGVPASSVNRDRCCPIPPAQPTTAACTLSTSTVIDASTEIPDVISNVGSDAEAGSAPEGSAPPDAGHDADASTEIPDVISDVGSDAEAGSAPEGSAPPDAGHADALPE